MIKINIPNIRQKKQEYIDLLKPLVLLEIKLLIKSLSHLNGSVIDFTDGHFAKIKGKTNSIIELVEGKKLDLNRQTNYTIKVNEYIAKANNLGDININGLLNFFKYLSNKNAVELERLLICSPKKLENLNKYLLKRFAINTERNIQVLKLAFDYDGFSDISDLIKQFFRINNFALTCPYCNYADIEYIQMHDNDTPAFIHQLDHFYFKAANPLLAYSFFNLIPSDYNCNTTNKGQKKFSNKYHLNPYIGGLENEITFFPITLSTKLVVNEIDVKLNVLNTSKKFKQLVGDDNVINEESDKGNLNVFKIKSKYYNKTSKAERVLKIISNTHKSFKSKTKFIKALVGLDQTANYIKWYELTFDTPFHKNGFNNKPFSKFNRDIHDFYFKNYPNFSTNYIKKLITEN